jgi:thioredoxin 1
MKKLTGLLFLAILSMAFTISSTSNSNKAGAGIKFKKMSFEAAKKEAKKSNKIIFIDAYTSWCGPCKKMAATTFQDSKVGEVHNSKFINLKFDMEQEADGLFISEKYRVEAYPTLLYINGDGKLIKSVVGFQTPDRLISIANGIE